MTAYRFAQPELGEVAIFRDRLTVFTVFASLKGTGRLQMGPIEAGRGKATLSHVLDLLGWTCEAGQY